MGNDGQCLQVGTDSYTQTYCTVNGIVTATCRDDLVSMWPFRCKNGVNMVCNEDMVYVRQKNSISARIFKSDFHFYRKNT